MEMVNMLVQQKVKDFSSWKKVYDSNKDLRVSMGAQSGQVFRDASDPNKITILFKWDSLANAQKFAHSAELQAAREKAGVEGQQSINFLNEA
jgi:heme-degrading monooxygenase HmoA